MRRRRRHLAIGVLAVLLALPVATILVLRSSWVRDWARAKVEGGLAAATGGRARVGHFDFTLSGDVVLRDVLVTDATGATLLSAPSVRAQVSLWALRRDALEVDEALLERPFVDADRIHPPPTPPGGKGLAIRAEGIRISGGTLVAGGRRIEGIEAKAEYRNGAAVLRSVRARVEGMDVEGSGFVHHAPGLVMGGVSLRTARGEGTGLFLRRGETSYLAAAGQVDGIPLEVLGTGDDLVVSTRGAHWREFTIDGRARLDVPGRRAHVIAQLASDRVRADVEGAGRLEGAEVVVEWARARGETPDVAALEAPISGPARFSLEGRGRAGDFSAKGTVILDGPQAGAASVRALTLAVDLTGLPATPRGAISAEALDVVIPVDAGQVELQDAHLAGNLDGQRIDLGPLEVTSAGTTWRGRGGVVRREGNDWLLERIGLASRIGAVRLTRGRVRGSDFDLTLAVTRLDVERAQRALAPGTRAAWPLAGTVTAEATVGRHGGVLSTKIEGQGRRLVWRLDAPAMDVDAKASYQAGHLVGQAELHDDRGVGTLGVWLDVQGFRLTGLKSARFELSKVDLARLSAVLGRLPGLGGRADGTIVIEPGARAATIDLAVTGLRHPRLPEVWNAEGHGRWTAAGLEATGSAHVGATHIGPAKGTLALPFAVLLERREAILDAALDVDVAVKLPLGRLAQLGMIDQRLSGAVDSHLHVLGTARRPRIGLAGRITALRAGELAFGDVTFDAEADHVGVDGNAVLTARGGGRARAHGSITWDQHLDLSLHVEKLDVRPLSPLVPTLAPIAGRVDGDLRVRGPASALVRQGSLALKDGRVSFAGGVVQLDGVTAHAYLEGDRLRLDTFEARSRKGTLSAKGELHLVGLSADRVVLDLDGKGIPVVAGASVVRVALRAHLVGRRASGRWLLDAEVLDGHVQLPATQGRKLLPIGPLDDVVFAAPSPTAGGARLPGTPYAVVHVTSGSAARLRVTSPEVKQVRLSVDILAELSPRGMRLDGAILSERGGWVKMEGHTYELRHARVQLDRQRSFDPRIDLAMFKVFRTLTMYVSIRGRLSKPEIQLTSDPPRDEAQLFGYLLGGDPDDPAEERRGLSDVSSGVMAGVVAAKVKQELRRLVPVDVLRLDPGDPSGERQGGFEIGTWITEKLLVTWNHQSPSDPRANQNEAHVEYRLFRNWLLDTRFGDRSAGSADLLRVWRW